MKEITYLQSGQFTYNVIIDVDLGTTNGLEMNTTNALQSTQTLVQGVNPAFTITPTSSSSVLSILPTDQSQTHNFTINSITIEKVSSSVWVTKDDITQVVDYYPYGKVLREYVYGDQERYLTTQHERDQATGLDYRGARYYDSDVARFLALDPLASEFPGWSTYNYVMGNPVMLVDPDGRAPDGIYKDAETGEVLFDDGVDDNNIHYVNKEDLFANNGSNPMFDYTPEERKELLKSIPLTTDVNVSDAEFEAAKTTNIPLWSRAKYNSTPPKYTFEAGETYSIESAYWEPASYAAGSYSRLRLSYNGESIETGGFAFGAELQIGGASGMRKREITFYQTMTGESLLEVFQNTDEINSFTAGAFLNYTSIKGLTTNTDKLWEINGCGGGFSAGFGGSQSVTNFQSIDK